MVVFPLVIVVVLSDVVVLLLFSVVLALVPLPEVVIKVGATLIAFDAPMLLLFKVVVLLMILLLLPSRTKSRTKTSVFRLPEVV